MRVAVVPGDGIGPEIIEQGIRVLDAAAERFALPLELVRISAGAKLYARTGEVISEADYRTTVEADAIYVGALGLPEVRFADGTEVQAALMVRWRRDLDLYANVRPLRSFAKVPSFYAEPRNVDVMVVREGTEGLYAASGGGAMIGDRLVADAMVITREGTERVCRKAFALARKSPPRNGLRPRVTCLDKANILRSFALFRRTFERVASEFPDVESETLYADAASILMTQHPERYHVMVMENFLGDIFSDLAAAYVGGLGLAPSGEVGDRHGMFQPAHGSAPTLAGTDAANPIATVLSAGMLLEYLGDRGGGAQFAAAARAIDDAVEAALDDPRNHTRDLGGSATTRNCGSAIVAALAGAGVAAR